MSVGNFRETNEANESRENNDNTEKPRNQILETPESYDDDFDSRLDNKKREDESKKEGNSEGNESIVEKTSFLDKMRNLFAKKASSEESGEADDKNAKEGSRETNQRSSFLDYLRKDVPSMEEQAENAKELKGMEGYRDDREKSEQAKRDYPELKDWELSPEQLKEAQRGQQDVAREGPSERTEPKNESNGEGRNPVDEAWERVFGRIEGEE